MTGVIEDAGTASRSDPRHEARRHGPQTGPRHHTGRADVGEQLLCPVDEWLDAAGTDVAVLAVEFCSARDPEAIMAKAAGDDLSLVIEQAHQRRCGLALRVVEVDADRVTLDRIYIETIPQHRRKVPARHTSADHDGIDLQA